MAIDAKIAGLRITETETVLTLEPREQRTSAGQETLSIINTEIAGTVNEIATLLDCEIWGGSSEIMLGETKLGNRIGYTGIELVPDWREVVRKYRVKKGLPTG